MDIVEAIGMQKTGWDFRNNWESPPTVEELNNDSINTTYYDWVRSYELVPAE